jgi:hypothetical protein
MSVTATTSSTFEHKQEVSRPNQITLDLDTLPEEYAGLKPHHIIIGE